MAARVRALETILVGKELVDPAAIDAIVETYETKIGPRNGAKVVARSWVDPNLCMIVAQLLKALPRGRHRVGALGPLRS